VFGLGDSTVGVCHPRLLQWAQENEGAGEEKVVGFWVPSCIEEKGEKVT